MLYNCSANGLINTVCVFPHPLLIHSLVDAPDKCILDGIPPLARVRTLSASAPHIPVNHQPVQLEERDTFVFTRRALTRRRSKAWVLADKVWLEWSSEASLVSHVRVLLQDVVAALLLSNRISITEEVTIHSLRPNLLVICDNQHPIGVVEIKPPHDEIFKNSKVNGQIFNYMRRLREYFGLVDVFGIVTTYSQWRIYWLSDSDAAASTDLLDLPTPTKIEVAENFEDDDGAVVDVSEEQDDRYTPTSAK